MTIADWVAIIDAMELGKVGSQDITRKDSEWVKLWDERWSAVENWWRSYSYMSDDNLDTASLRTLLTKLQAIVPTKKIMNGTELRIHHVHPNDVPAHLKGAAMILLQGELECVVKGDAFLPNPVQTWETVCVDIRQRMKLLLNEDEVTEGDTSISRQSHARAALGALDAVELARTAFLSDVSANEASFGEDSLQQLPAELALFAFSAGVHARLALGKRIEQWAVVGKAAATHIERRNEGSKRGAKSVAEKAAAERKPVMDAMLRRIKQNQSAPLAASRVYQQEQLGKSAEKNLKLWRRYGKKFQYDYS